MIGQPIDSRIIDNYINAPHWPAVQKCMATEIESDRQMCYFPTICRKVIPTLPPNPETDGIAITGRQGKRVTLCDRQSEYA